MSLSDQTGDDTMLEECIEELEELVMSLDRYPPATVVAAMGTHLEGLLGALIDERQCTADEAREFLREIESGALEQQAAAR